MQNHHQQHHGWLGGEVLPAEANQKKHQDDFWLHPWASLRLDTFSSGQGFCELKFRLQDFFVNSSDFYHQMALTGHVSIKFTPLMFRKIVFFFAIYCVGLLQTIPRRHPFFLSSTDVILLKTATALLLLKGHIQPKHLGKVNNLQHLVEQ